MLPFVNSLWSMPKPTDQVDTDVEMGVKNMVNSKLNTALYLSNMVVFMQLPTPTHQLQPVQIHPLGPQDQSSQLEHNARTQPLPVTSINSPSGEPSQPEHDAHPIPHLLGSPFRHSPPAGINLSKVRLRGMSTQSSRRRGRPQTPPRQPEDTRRPDVVSGKIY